MTNSEAPPSQGLVAGKYELVRLIGRGGMGSVWEAKHVSLGTSSAIKFIESEYANSQEARSRFDKEAKAAATIQSKHAIQIYDHGVTDDGKPYIVMELLRGEPLDKMIDRGPIGLIETARILQQVCRGLARAHDRGIIHRDLKPENIFLVRTPDEDEAVAKVLDFGIAKMQNSGPASGLTSSTKTGAVLGTPFYMSPEQARGLRNVDHRADVWSLGVIAFKCVTGKLPFDGESVGDLLVKICTAPVPIPSQVAASLGIGGVPPSFDAWFIRALDREPDRRFPTVVQLAEELCAVAGIHQRGGVPASQYTPNSNITSHQMPMSQMPAGSGGGHYGSGPGATPNNIAYGAAQATPPPGAMTNAPFTREEISAVPTGKGKLVVGGIVAGLLAIVAVGAIALTLQKSALQRIDPAHGVGVVTAATSGASTPPTDTPPEPPPASSPTTPLSGTPAAKNVETSNGPTPGTRPGRTGIAPAKPTAAPPTPPVKTTTPPTPPLPPPTPTQTTAPTPPKKPNKNDPGY
jgi:eukaryotic-like serine/threonine-protein kinase